MIFLNKKGFGKVRDSCKDPGIAMDLCKDRLGLNSAEKQLTARNVVM